MSVILPKQVDVSKLRYSEVKTLSSGAKNIYINYGSERLTIQTPLMYIPYGINDNSNFKDKAGASPIDKKYDITVSFNGMDKNTKLQLFYDKLKEIENKIIDDAFTNRVLWFKDDYDGNKTFVARMFSPFVKIDKDKETGKPANKYPPTFKARAPYDNSKDAFVFDCFDMDDEEINFADIIDKLKGSSVMLIVQLTGLWLAGGKYGCSWKISCAKFKLSQKSKPVFIKESDDEKDEEEEDEKDEEEEIEPEENILQNQMKKQENNSDEDDEDDEEEEKIKLPKKPTVQEKKSDKKGRTKK